MPLHSNLSTESGSSVVKEIKDEVDGHEDKSDVIVIPWKAAAIAKYAP